MIKESQCINCKTKTKCIEIISRYPKYNICKKCLQIEYNYNIILKSGIKDNMSIEIKEFINEIR